MLLAFLCALSLIVHTAVPAYASYVPPFDIRAKAVYMVNLDTDKVIYERSAQEKMYPASLTKIMTAILVLEKVDDLDGIKLPLKLYIQDMLYNTNASLAGIYLGEEVSIRNLLYASLLQSGNEAALMLADYVGDGSISAFVEMMNEKAADIGAKNTHFANPNGLHDPENYTTAYDMNLIARYALDVPGFTQIANTPTMEIGPTNKQESLVMTTTNWMIQKGSQYYYGPVSNIKTGTLDEAGRCLVTTAARDGFTYLLVLMNAPYKDENGAIYPERYDFDETRKLYEWAFETFVVKKLAEQNKAITEVPVRLSGEEDHVNLVCAEAFTSLVPADVEVGSIQFIPEIPEYIDAPVERGQEIGMAHVMLSGEELGQIKLVAGSSVSRSTLLFALDEAQKLLQYFWVKFALILIVTLIALYIFIMISRNRRRRNYNNRRSSGGRGNRYL